MEKATEKFMENAQGDLPFDIHNEPNITNSQPIIDDPEEQKMLAKRIGDARKKLAETNNNISDKEYTDKTERIKVKFNDTISKLSDLHTSYDELWIKSNIQGNRKIPKDKLDSEWEKLNGILKQIHRDIQGVYTDWTIITANHLNK